MGPYLLKLCLSLISFQDQESGRSTPKSAASEATVQDVPVSQAEVIASNGSHVVVVNTPHTGNANLVEKATPLIEVSSDPDPQRASSVPKDIKESQNYAKKQHQQKTNSVGIQVNLLEGPALEIVPAKTQPAVPRLAEKLAHLAAEPEEMNLDQYLIKNNKTHYESKTLPRRKSNNDVPKLIKQSSVEEKPAPLRRGYTHDAMLGLESKNPAWMKELNKIRSLKPIRITELIGELNFFRTKIGDGTTSCPNAEARATH